ncbi:hypothetical protein BKA63DRAFT_8068 [Paraphoma chrysanthemicola]|nr:hypothetical protein BKA63DRAFT_8068 [Paraphoma chrysanthemicola]
MRSIRSRRSIWKQDGRVIIENEHGRERKQHAIVLFDPQCQKDVVSTAFLQERFGLSFDGLTQEALGYSITGQEEFVSVGRQAIRWWAPNLNRYENAFCRVVRSSRFDLIIGEETITKLDIFKPGLIAAFMTPRAGLNAVDVSETHRQAKVRREQERKEKEQREKEKKERQRREKQQVSRTTLPRM